MKEYLKSKEAVLADLETGDGGLSPSEAGARLARNGKNKLKESKKKTMLMRIWAELRNPMVLVLIAAGIVSGGFGEYADMVIILIVVALNTALGIFQEKKSEKAIEALQKMFSPHSRVRRGGAVSVVDSEDIVVGDIVLLESGDFVPADMRITSSTILKVEEAALTGESVASEKTAETLSGDGGDIPLGDRVNMLYAGTSVAYGHGEGVVTATGMDTEMGKIADVISQTDDAQTPLQRKLAGLSKVLSVTVLIICAFIFIFNVLTHGGFSGGHVLESLLTSVSLAVAAIPEGLVVVVTVLLSIGVTKMSARNAIVRRLTAVETLGCTQVICSDKTGTLTQNKMTVVEHYGDENLLARAVSLCCDVQCGAGGTIIGDPTEVALVEYARSIGQVNTSHCTGEIPFDSSRKMMSTFYQHEGGGVVQYTKGAPDVILEYCDRIWIDGEIKPLDAESRQAVLDANKKMAANALRVIAGAFRMHDEMPQKLDSETLETEMVIIGLVGMIDPLRVEVKDAVEQCKTAGIRAIMITGDHKDTAVAIARNLGILEDESQAVTGLELNAMSDPEFDARIENISVYARVQPEHKVRIVNAWKRKGKITAMTGDGVNDAPALKSADIGVGMGISGTDVTKNVAGIVLSDDNFSTIVYAVEEGRRIYENIRKTVQFLLSSNLAEVIAIFIATIAGFRLFAPIHILWINLVTDSFPAIALGMEGAEKDIMEKPPRRPDESIFAGGLGINVFFQGAVIGLLTLASFLIGRAAANSEITGMTMAFLTLSISEIFHSFNMRSLDKSIFSLEGHNRYLFMAMLLSFVLTFCVIYIPGLNTVFKLTALSVKHFFISFGLSFSIIPITEVYKIVKRSVARRRQKQ